MTTEIRVWNLLEVGRYDEARAEAEAALARHPEDGRLLYLLSFAVRELESAEKAITIIRRALVVEPSSADYHAQLAILLARTRKFQDSYAAFKASLALDLSNDAALSGYIEALIADPRSASDRSRHVYVRRATLLANQLLQASPEKSLSHRMKARAELFAGDLLSAERSARTALVIEPNSSYNHEVLGLVLQTQGRTRSASDSFVAAAKADPTSSLGPQLLERLGKGPAAPIGFAMVIGLLAFMRMSRNGALALGVPDTIIFAGIAALTVTFLVVRGLIARTKLSPEAREILRRQRKLR